MSYVTHKIIGGDYVVFIEETPKREPDFISGGYRVWLEERVATYGDYRYALMVCEHSGALLKAIVHKEVNYEPFKPTIQKSYLKYLKDTADKILIGGNDVKV